jgi:hypothetical protein
MADTESAPLARFPGAKALGKTCCRYVRSNDAIHDAGRGRADERTAAPVSLSPLFLPLFPNEFQGLGSGSRAASAGRGGGCRPDGRKRQTPTRARPSRAEARLARPRFSAGTFCHTARKPVPPHPGDSGWSRGFPSFIARRARIRRRQRVPRRLEASTSECRRRLPPVRELPLLSFFLLFSITGLPRIHRMGLRQARACRWNRSRMSRRWTA